MLNDDLHAPVLRLGHAIASCVLASFPGAESIGLSIGHKGKPGAPHDRGAAVLGGGTEADCAEMYLAALAEALGLSS